MLFYIFDNKTINFVKNNTLNMTESWKGCDFLHNHTMLLYCHFIKKHDKCYFLKLSGMLLCISNGRLNLNGELKIIYMMSVKSRLI